MAVKTPEAPVRPATNTAGEQNGNGKRDFTGFSFRQLLDASPIVAAATGSEVKPLSDAAATEKKVDTKPASAAAEQPAPLSGQPTELRTRQAGLAEQATAQQPLDMQRALARVGGSSAAVQVEGRQSAGLTLKPAAGPRPVR